MFVSLQEKKTMDTEMTEVTLFANLNLKKKVNNFIQQS